MMIHEAIIRAIAHDHTGHMTYPRLRAKVNGHPKAAQIAIALIGLLDDGAVTAVECCDGHTLGERVTVYRLAKPVHVGDAP